MKIAIVIPARYSSTRFPGKPLAAIGGRTMLARVAAIAQRAAQGDPDISVAVATDDDRIADHARVLGVACHMTSPACVTGSDRVLEAAEKMGGVFDFIVNFQADRPFTHPVVLTEIIAQIRKHQKAIEVITPVHRLSWDELAELEESKKTTPFSGTTVVRHEGGTRAGYALWFSKQILPAIRNRADRIRIGEQCPVLKHIGLYGFRSDILKKYAALKPTTYESCEGLEQLRMIENGISIFTADIAFDDKAATLRKFQIGIDAPEDVAAVEALLETYGEPF